MSRRRVRRHSQNKKINPTFFVFCEGKTEEEYIKYLRSRYRIPIEINSKQAGSNISQKFVNTYLKNKPRHQKDIVFLLYNLDLEGLLEKLQSIDGILLVSNPCIELWFLLHFKNQTANISGDSCIRGLKKLCNLYKKGNLSTDLRKHLDEFIEEAVERSEKLREFINPSTTIYRLIKRLKEVKANKR